MMLEPGWVAGSVISASPARGPLASHRRSLATLVIATAREFRAPWANTMVSRDACRSKWFPASQKPSPTAWPMRLMVFSANSGCVLIPVPTAVPPSGSSAMSSLASFTRRMACSIWDA